VSQTALRKLSNKLSRELLTIQDPGQYWDQRLVLPQQVSVSVSVKVSIEVRRTALGDSLVDRSNLQR